MKMLRAVFALAVTATAALSVQPADAQVKRYKVTVTTAADGTATAYSPRLSGSIKEIEYVKDGSNGYATGVDFTITSEATGKAIWTENDVNASALRAPRVATHSTAGVASLYASGGTAVQSPVSVGNDRVKIGIASGGNAKVGVFHILVE